MEQKTYLQNGSPPEQSGKVLIMVHGRGATPEDILQLAAYLPAEGFTLAAPGAPSNTWYPYSFLAPAVQNQPYLDQSLATLDNIRREMNSKGISDGQIYWLGFSQGACLALEYTTRNASRYGGVIAFTGGLIGSKPDEVLYNGDFGGTPVLLASADPDPHVPVERVLESARIIDKMNANVLTRIYKGMGHTVTQDEIRDAAGHVFKQGETLI